MKFGFSQPLLKAYFWIIIGSIGYCIGFNWLFEPNQIAFGGITGIAQVVNAILPFVPIGGLTFFLNIPLFFFGWKYLGGHLLLSSLFSMFLTSWGLDVLTALHTFQPMEDQLLASIFGGLTVGLSMGVIFAQGATTGGADLAARLLKLKLSWLPLGKVLLLLDLIVVVAAALVFGHVKTALYGIVAMFVSAYATDYVLYGMDNAKVAYVITGKTDQVLDVLVHQLGRGVTVLHGTGAWSGEEKLVLMCAFKQRQIVAVKQAVKETDPDAFLIVCNAHEILGRGFRAYTRNEI